MARERIVIGHVCSFSSCAPVSRKTKYSKLRDEVLKAGCFSVFEATASNQAAAMFMDLERDPTLVVERTMAFPWIGPIRRRDDDRTK